MKRSTASRLAASRLFRRLIASCLSLIIIISLAYLGLCWQRPPQTAIELPLFQGITYKRDVINQPRPIVMHLVRIDLTTPGLQFFVTPGDSSQGRDIRAQKTSKFLQKYQLQLAINAGFFEPFYVHSPWNYYPHTGDPVAIKGLAISNGILYSSSSPSHKEPVLCLGFEHQVEIHRGSCPFNARHAVSGNFMLVNQGKPVAPIDRFTEPRTAVCLDSNQHRLWLLLIDGRQPFYSQGMRLIEVANLAIQLGCDQAFNLDGGGSTTLVYAAPNARILNAPFHTRIPLRERAVGNHLGVYALPL